MRNTFFSRPLLIAFLGLTVAAVQPGCATPKSGGGGSGGGAQPASAAEDLGPNLALNKPAVSSSDEKPELAAQYAVDGNKSTRWGSNFFTDKNPSDAWIYIDLGEKKIIGTAVITWEAAFGLDYQILVSDDAKDWKMAFEEKSGHAGKSVHKISPPAEGRYVKLLGIKRGTAYGYSPWEIEIYGK
jgi:hypothetical protein